jgi:hypothetical protein
MCFPGNGSEGLCGRCLLTVAGHKVVHHFNERLVLVPVVVPHGTQHLEDIGTLGVSQVLVGAFGTGRNQTQALSRFQIRGHEPAEAVRKEDNRLRQIAARDFDPGLGNDGARGIFDGSGNRRRVQPCGTRQPEPGYREQEQDRLEQGS